MNFFRRTLACIAVFVLSSAAQAARFPRVLVLSGGDLQAAVFLGMLDGVRSRGWEPDVVLTSCGSSLAGALINAVPDSADQRRFMESRTAYETFRSLRLDPRVARMTSILPRIAYLRSPFSRWYFPDLFRDVLMRIPTDLVPTQFPSMGPAEVAVLANLFNRPFQAGPGKIRSVMVSGKVLYGETDVYRNRYRGKRKLFREVFFTDPDTGARLKGLRSAVAGFAGSTVDSATEVIAGPSIWQAARASVADPFYINPMVIDDDHYITGALDLYPLEAANALGEEIAMTYAAPYGWVEQTVASASWGFHNNSRLRQITRRWVDHWIDFTDTGTSAYRAMSLSPKVTLSGVHSAFPRDYAGYVARIRQQWAYGRARGAEAIAQPAGSRRHIRRLN